MIVLVIKISALIFTQLIRMRIQETKIMRIHADADPQHCSRDFCPLLFSIYRTHLGP